MAREFALESPKVFIMPSDFERRIKVFRAIDRPLDDLKTDDLCEKANISRRTFYRLFGSKYDVVSWYIGIVNGMSVVEIGRTLSWKDAYWRFFTLIEAERDTFRRAQLDLHQHDLWNQGVEKRRSHVLETLSEKRVSVDEALMVEIESYIQTEFYVSWYAQYKNKSLSVDDLANLMVDCVPGGLKAMLGRS